MDKNAKIWVTGSTGMVGGAVHKLLQKQGYTNVCTNTSSQVDLRDQKQVIKFFQQNQPEYIFLSAAKVGGIYANMKYPAQFIYDNLIIASNVIHTAYEYKIKRLLFFGSSCIYPKHAEQPIKESALLSGYLEPTNESYAIAKIAGLTLCKSYNSEYGTDFRTIMPCNLYGSGDNFHLENSHVMAAILRKVHQAKKQGIKKIKLWGSGQVLREFLFIEDLAEAALFIMRLPFEKLQFADNVWKHINVGSGKDITIHELAKLICQVVGYQGQIEWDISVPDGTPRKLLDITRILQLGWKPKTTLEQGIRSTYQWMCKKYHRSLIFLLLP